MSNTAKCNIQLRTLSSLAKVFPDRIYGKATKSCPAAAGQEISFQIAFRLPPREKYKYEDLRIEVHSALEDISLFSVGYVPGVMPVYPDRIDDNYITTKPSVFPDVLYPVKNNTVTAKAYIWSSLWVSAKIPANCTEGEYPVTVSFYNNEGNVKKATFKINVEAYALPPQKLLFTQWFHCDCIADIHGVKIFSEAHWALIDSYMSLAAEHGMNMILTPLLTPPLDTAIGGERPTVQLVDITLDEKGYSFDFSRLRRFVELARSNGIDHFEISHMFTQWGATMAPKVIAKVNGKSKRIFGWDTDASDKSYADFLGALIPQTIAQLVSMGVSKNDIFFHVSDEPYIRHLESYGKAKSILAPLIEGCRHMDALSDIEFHKNGLIETPVVAINRIAPYIEEKVDPLWCYYCCSQCVDVSNRFFAMPSARNRIIGVQIYKYNIEGFLQWGYNFYYSHHSIKMIDPYTDASSDFAFPAGDPFSVYPYENRAIPSLRVKVFANALEDVRLLTLLEEKIGKENTVALIERVAGMEITFDKYPKSDEFFDRLYCEIFKELKK